MKLFTKYNRTNIATTLISFFAGSIAFYFVLNLVLTNQLDRSLRVEQQEITDYSIVHNNLPFIPNTRHQWLTIDTAVTITPETGPLNKTLFNPIQQESEPVRQLTFSISTNNRFYRISVNQSRTETEDMLQLIIFITIGMIFLLLLLNYFINRKIVNQLLQPFYDTISRIRNYETAKSSPLEAIHTGIEEIDLLNESVNRMTLRISNDYATLRSFTENASHEMQTPLSVIKLKTEALLQKIENDLPALQQVLVIEDATNKLSRLHQSLLLLTRLENRQYTLTEEVNIEELLHKKIAEYEELINSLQLKLNIASTKNILQFHHHLADIMLGNLISNIIRYTPIGGVVDIHLSKTQLSFSNTAQHGQLDDKKVFNRFYKNEQSTESTGLGLAIIKEICIVAGYSIHYNYRSSIHSFTINFTPPSSELLQNG